MIEKIFQFVQIEDVEKVKCADYMLRKDAGIWWDVVKKTCDVATMTQAEFLIEFNYKYSSQVVINSKVAEFTMLQQRNMQYWNMFDNLTNCRDMHRIWFSPKEAKFGDF